MILQSEQSVSRGSQGFTLAQLSWETQQRPRKWRLPSSRRPYTSRYPHAGIYAMGQRGPQYDRTRYSYQIQSAFAEEEAVLHRTCMVV
jgi:hypothetical protein